MKLFYSPAVCSLVPHIVLRELGASFELEKVIDLEAKKMEHGGVLHDVNEKDYVPVLDLDDGTRITELSVIVRYLADKHPEAKLAPPHGTIERVRFEELLHFISTEMHKGFLAFSMMPNMSEESLAWQKARLDRRVETLKKQLGDRQFIFGDSFTVADAYLWWALRAYGFLTKTKLDGTLKDYLGRIGSRESVKSAIAAEKH